MFYKFLFIQFKDSLNMSANTVTQNVYPSNLSDFTVYLFFYHNGTKDFLSWSPQFELHVFWAINSFY